MISVFLQCGLLIWFLVSMYLVYTDNTLSTTLKEVGYILNSFSILFILANMFNQNGGFLYFGVGALLLAWYLYYTPQDITNPGYTPLQKVCYGSIDVIFIVYLIASMTLSWFHIHLDKFDIALNTNHIQQFCLG